jgi:F-type H+-transporting ATPase subunit epsilon
VRGGVEPAEAIDVERARSARRRAEERLKRKAADTDLARAEAALKRSLLRLEVAGKAGRI